MILKIKPDISIDIAVKKVKRIALLNPYVLLTQPVKIEIIDLEPSGARLRVLAYSMNGETAKLFEKELDIILRKIRLI